MTFEETLRQIVREELAALPQPLPAEEPDEVLNTAKAAKLLGVDVDTIRDACEQGRIPGQRIGNGYKFSRRALLDWIGKRGHFAKGSN